MRRLAIAGVVACSMLMVACPVSASEPETSLKGSSDELGPVFFGKYYVASPKVARDASPALPTLTFSGAPLPRGSLDKRLVARVIRLHRPQLQSCYERSLQVRHDLRGRVVLRWVVGTEGKVEDVELIDDELGVPELARCLEDAIGAWRFPATVRGEPVRVSYPVQFVPG